MNLTRELERLRALEAYAVLDTSPEEAFDRMTCLAADLFDAPIALVSLVDSERQWFKSHHGVDATQTPREWAFCSHAIEMGPKAVLVVEDATRDPRFAENPLVTGEPDIRFYAGAVLTTPEGYNLGTLCVIDRKPRLQPSPADIKRLQALASVVVDQLELARARRQAIERGKIVGLAEAMSGVGHWSYDLATDRVTWSDEVYRIHGVTREGFDPNLNNAMDFYLPADREKLVDMWAEAVKHKTGYAFQLKIRRADGAQRTVIAKAVCDLNEAGEVTTIFGVFQDVTEREATLRAVQRSEAQYRLLADHMGDVITRVRLDGSSNYISPAIESLLGYRPAEMAGQLAHAFVHEDDRPVVAAAFAEIAQGMESKTLQHRAIHKSGAAVWVETHFQRVGDTASAPAEIVAVIRDNTARKALEEKLRDALARAEASVEAKTEFLANMSHEIRTPLTGIIGFSDLLSELDNLPDDAARYVRRIRTAGRTLLTVVNDVLDFSKLEAGQLELDPHPFETLNFIEETVELVAAQAANKGLALELRAAGALPAWVEADSARLRQILLNLLTNAIKFTAAGGVTVEVSHGAGVDGVLRIAVTDTGAGIPADRLHRLFQRFSQVDGSISRGHGGTGLGLAICKSLTQLMGGGVGVDSQEGRGSTFWFTVRAPVIDAPTETVAAPVQDDQQARPARILIVDDITANRELVRAMLTPFGHEFEEADNGVDAVRMAMQSAFDLILMDLQMPGMDGLAATRTIRASSEVNRGTPILALSANVLSAQVEACHAAGMDGHIAKPIKPIDLLLKVAQWTAMGNLFETPSQTTGFRGAA